MFSLVLFVLSLVGIAAGFLVAMIAIEELRSGKKYFKYLKYGILVLISIFVIWQMIILHAYLAIALFVIVLIGIVTIDTKKKKLRIESLYYVLFLGLFLYFGMQDVARDIQTIFATLVSLYGLVFGTHLHIRVLEGKQK